MVVQEAALSHCCALREGLRKSLRCGLCADTLKCSFRRKSFAFGKLLDSGFHRNDGNRRFEPISSEVADVIGQIYSDLPLKSTGLIAGLAPASDPVASRTVCETTYWAHNATTSGYGRTSVSTHACFDHGRARRSLPWREDGAAICFLGRLSIDSRCARHRRWPRRHVVALWVFYRRRVCACRSCSGRVWGVV